MAPETHGTIAALEFRTRPDIDFVDIVEEFDIAFQMADSNQRSLTWDCEDIAIIDRESLRVALGWLPPTEPGTSWYMVIGVGQLPEKTGSNVGRESFDFLTQCIIERTQAHLPFDAVLRGDARQPVDADLIDNVFDLLRLSSDAPRDDAQTNSAEQHDDESTRTPPWMGEGADIEASVDYRKTDIRSKAQSVLKSNFFQRRAQPTEPLRLAIHTFALSLMLYAPPLGAFLFTYTMLRDVFPVGA